MHLIMNTCFISGTLLLAFVAGQAFQIITRKDSTMANSADALVAAFAPVVALVGTQAQEISDLKAQLANIDPTVAADLAADEAAIADTIAKAQALLPATGA